MRVENYNFPNGKTNRTYNPITITMPVGHEVGTNDIVMIQVKLKMNGKVFLTLTNDATTTADPKVILQISGATRNTISIPSFLMPLEPAEYVYDMIIVRSGDNIPYLAGKWLIEETITEIV